MIHWKSSQELNSWVPNVPGTMRVFTCKPASWFCFSKWENSLIYWAPSISYSFKDYGLRKYKLPYWQNPNNSSIGVIWIHVQCKEFFIFERTCKEFGLWPLEKTCIPFFIPSYKSYNSWSYAESSAVSGLKYKTCFNGIYSFQLGDVVFK